MIRIDWSEPGGYYTQRNNERDPFGACNVTAAIMFMRENKIAYTNPTQEQDEDYLYWLLQQPDAWAAMERLCPWLVRKDVPPVVDWTNQKQIDARYSSAPNLQWAPLAWGINRLVGREVAAANYSPGLRENEFLFELVKGRPMVVGGLFTKSGHYVCASGFLTEQGDVLDALTPIEVRTPDVTHVIINDPYGDYNTGYASAAGERVEIPWGKFLDVVACFRNPAYGRQYRIYAIMKKAA